MKTIPFNIKLFLLTRILISISGSTIVFSSVWWLINQLDSILAGGTAYLVYRTFEIYLMPFTSAISDMIDRRWLLFINACLGLVVAIIYSTCFLWLGYLPMVVTVAGMIILGIISSMGTGLVTASLHDIYKTRVRVVLRLNGLFSSISMVLGPIVSMAYTISFGSQSSVYLATVLLCFGAFYQYTLLGLKTVQVRKTEHFQPAAIIKNTSRILTGMLKIPVERCISSILLCINMVMTPFFMVLFPYMASHGYFSFPQAIALFDIAFALGFIAANKLFLKWVQIKWGRAFQVCFGLILLTLMLNGGLIVSNTVAIACLCFVGGAGLPFVVVNISSYRINACPKEMKSQCFGSLVFLSLAGNPLAIMISGYILKHFPIEYIYVYNLLLTAIALAICLLTYRLLKSINHDSVANEEHYRAVITHSHPLRHPGFKTNTSETR